MRSFFFGLCIVVGLALMITSSTNEPKAALASSEPHADADKTTYPTVDERYKRAPLTVEATPKPTVAEEPTDDVQVAPTPVAAASEAEITADVPEVVESAPVASEAETTTPDEAVVDEPYSEPTSEPEVEPEVETPQMPAIVAEAGSPLDIWAGVGLVQLDASGSTGKGLSYSWEQLSGPTLEIDDSKAASPTLSGLLENLTTWEPVTYEFILTVTDQFGQQTSDTVTVISRGAPDLALVPNVAQDQYWTTETFDNYQGAMVPHFEAHVSSPLKAVVTFMIDADTPLNFTEVLSADFEMSYFEENGRHLYQFEVYKTTEEQTTLLELYAKTAKQIPAVILMSVDW